MEGISKTALLPSAVRLIRFTSSTVSSEGMYFFKKEKTRPGLWISVGEVNMSVVKSSCAVSNDLACNIQELHIRHELINSILVHTRPGL